MGFVMIICNLKKKILSIFCISLVVFNLFAFGKKETEDRELTQLDSWQENFDISEKKQGKYNIVVTATDIGGNIEVGGPYNIFIDPNSDLPIVGITNPLNGMSIPGNLNIVGTCIDDDAVDYVEIILDDDTANPVRAEGTDFWSYYLDTTKLLEGRHTIKVYGVDINGVRGNPATAFWHLNRRLPQTSVLSKEMGELVSGKQKIDGIITDGEGLGNGIKNLYFSADGGKTFEEIDFSVSEQNQKINFSITVDTTKVEDGPQIFWFKAVDGQNSVGIYSFLLFVDNTKPDVKIVYPKMDDEVNGRFSVSGYAKDVIGLESLKWIFNGLEGDIPVVPGNSYWCVDFDLRSVNTKAEEVIIEAKDIAGNITQVKRKIYVNQELDLASVNVLSPRQNANIFDDVILNGSATDDDGIKEIHYILDDKPEVTLNNEGVFFDNLTERYKNLSAGNHNLKVWAVDTDGIVGTKENIEFTIVSPKPQIKIVGIKDSTSQTIVPYVEGMEINPENSESLLCEVTSDCGFADIRWRFDSLSDKIYPLEKDTKGKLDIAIPLNNISWGSKELIISSLDIYERKTEVSLLFFLKNLTKNFVDEKEIKDDIVKTDNTAKLSIQSVAGVPYISGTVVSVPYKATVESGLNVVVAIESSIPLTQTHYSIDSATPKKITPLEKNTSQYEVLVPLVDLSHGLHTINVTAQRGKSTPISITGQFCVVRPAPKEGINDEEKVYWRNYTSDEINGYNITNENALVGYVNLDGEISGEFTKTYEGLKLTMEDKIVKITSEKEGNFYDVEIVFSNEKGNKIKTKPITLFADFAGPKIEILEPTEIKWVKDKVKVVGLVSENSKIIRSDYSVDGGNTYRSIELGNPTPDGEMPFNQEIDISMCEDGFIMIEILMQDSYGKKTTKNLYLQKDTVGPQVSVILPEAAEIVNGETKIVLNVRENGKLVSSKYIRSDGGKNLVRPNVEKQYDENGNEIIEKTEDIPLDEQEIGTTGSFELVINPLISTMIGTEKKPIEENMIFEFEDASGNITRLNDWDFEIDAESDKPIVEIHVPQEDEVITTDFVVSGVIYDDDGDKNKIWYSIDNAPFISMEKYDSSFAIPIPLSSMTDNEHIVTVYAEDRLGVVGEPIVRKFRISLEEPKAECIYPSIEETVNGFITLSGNASDKNGIAKVQVSIDNGNTFNDVVGRESWSYDFDTRIVQDGTHVVFIKVWDNYGIHGMYSSLINIDNTNPQIDLDLPLDGSKVNGNLFFSGRTTDNIGLKNLDIVIKNLDLKQIAVPKNLSKIKLTPDEIISEVIDISSLSDGEYNIEVVGEDAGGNITRVSRNIILDKSEVSTKVDILYPLNGEHVQGMFNLYGNVSTEKEVNSLMLYIDEEEVAMTDVTNTGYFKFTITPELLSGGTHIFTVRALIDEKTVVTSGDRYLIYTPSGPWITIDNFTMGDYAIDRPFIEGSAGYAFTESQLLKLRDKDTSDVEKKELKAKTVERIELSFDNGKTFEEVSKNRKWRYRFENGDKAQGYYFMLVRATMKNGETAVTRSIIQVDKTKPIVRLISPGEGGRFNESIKFSGLASDDLALKNVTLSLRSGDKSSYSIPSFIQGLYFDWHFWGATLYDIGAGLTFFDDNVKVQFQFGQFTQQQYNLMEEVFGFTPTKMRYGGNVFGFKMLANLAYIPFSHFWGPNWEWLSANVAIGANFSRYDNTQSGKPQILSAILGQLEFPRITIPKQKYFRTFSFYTEFQLWFIPTDVDSAVDIDSLVPQISGGIRMNVF